MPGERVEVGSLNPAWIEPDWPAPPWVRAVSTLRVGGCSSGPFGSLNLGAHVGDAPEAVATNRRRLRRALDIPQEPVWLTQVHGNRVVSAHEAGDRIGDAAATDRARTVCAVMTADCLPILLCDRSGVRVAAVHAGWRGLAGGVVEAAVAALASQGLLAWLGPAIGPAAFQVGADVVQAFSGLREARAAFVADGEDRWLADIYALAGAVLRRAGVDEIYGGGRCTHSDPDRFFSYRRDGQTGRMATLIWREE